MILLLIAPNLVFADYQSNKERLQPKIEQYANKYGVSAEMMNQIIDGESSYDKTVIGDTDLICKRTGKPMKAVGLVQINTSCYWPGITEAQATDEDFSLDFLAKWIGKGKCRTFWSTCKIPEYLAMK